VRVSRRTGIQLESFSACRGMIPVDPILFPSETRRESLRAPKVLERIQELVPWNSFLLLTRNCVSWLLASPPVPVQEFLKKAERLFVLQTRIFLFPSFLFWVKYHITV